MPVSVIRFFAVTFALLMVVPACCAGAAAGPIVAGYVFPQNMTLQPGQVDARNLTWIYYAFANIADGRMVEGFAADAQNLPQVVALKRENPKLKVLISVGGWNWSGGFSDAALTPQSRARFIESAVEFLRRYNLDGMDLDWEYLGQPGAGHSYRKEDRENFTALVRELRQRLNAESGRTHSRLYLTIAAGASLQYLEDTQMDQVQRFVDAVNLMTYDSYVPGADATTGNHAPLYADPADPKRASADAAVKAFVKAGVPAAKILLGVPFYGKAWSDVADAHHGLFQPGKAASGGDLPYGAITGTMLGHGFTRYWDDASSVPYLYSAEKREFVTYEDPESIATKCDYVLHHGLGGIMFWNYFNDPSGTLLDAIHTAMHQRKPVPAGR